MRQSALIRAAFLVFVLIPIASLAQSSRDQSASVPRLITITGVFRPADGQPPNAVETVTLSIYADQQGGTPVWQETQSVVLDDKGRYTLQLGATHPDGIPPAVFASGTQWLGTVFERPAEVEGPRVRLTSVPYALHAADADTLGGHPASDYALTGTDAGRTAGVTSTQDSSVAAPAGELPGTPNFLAKYVDANNVGPSNIFESGLGLVGIGTTAPQDFLHVRYTNTNGGATGLAVQNLGNTATSYSGMLFYDQNGALGQFQGFNNVTHEYRINNIAKNGTSQFDGSINFMLGSNSRFFVGANGLIGINTTTPSANLELTNNLTSVGAAAVFATTYTGTPNGSGFIGRKARGTSTAPAAVLNGDTLAAYLGRGYGTTNFGTGGGGMFLRASENWTDTAQGTSMNFNTTANGTAGPITRMTITHDGNVGIGTSAPQGDLEVSRTGHDVAVVATSFANGTGSAPFYVTWAARGTQAAPTAVQTGDLLGAFGGGGYGTTTFHDIQGVFGSLAAENFSDTARGASLVFGTTPLGTIDVAFVMGILPNGNVGIGTPVDVNELPTATDRLQVFGDARVGNAGTNGCLKRFDGTGLVGACSSDRRLKKNITPFGPVLNQLTALQPVHYFWRAADFPERHFGNSQSYGLIAQDVEQVLPELVSTDTDGYEAVDYSKLPLLTIQAVKELKAGNDALKAENDALKHRVTELEPLTQRVAELERLMADLLATAGRR